MPILFMAHIAKKNFIPQARLPSKWEGNLMKAKNYFPQKIRYFAARAELANETFCRKPYIF